MRCFHISSHNLSEQYWQRVSFELSLLAQANRSCSYLGCSSALLIGFIAYHVGLLIWWYYGKTTWTIKRRTFTDHRNARSWTRHKYIWCKQNAKLSRKHRRHKKSFPLLLNVSLRRKRKLQRRRMQRLHASKRRPEHGWDMGSSK